MKMHNVLRWGVTIIGADFRQGEPPFAVDQAVEGASVVPPFLGKAAFRVVD